MTFNLLSSLLSSTFGCGGSYGGFGNYGSAETFSASCSGGSTRSTRSTRSSRNTCYPPASNGSNSPRPSTGNGSAPQPQPNTGNGSAPRPSTGNGSAPQPQPNTGNGSAPRPSTGNGSAPQPHPNTGNGSAPRPSTGNGSAPQPQPNTGNGSAPRPSTGNGSAPQPQPNTGNPAIDHPECYDANAPKPKGPVWDVPITTKGHGDGNGVVNYGPYNIVFTQMDALVQVTDKRTGERTIVWGDPHLTSPNGSQQTMTGDFRLKMPDGVTITIQTCDDDGNPVDAQGRLADGTESTATYADRVTISGLGDSVTVTNCSGKSQKGEGLAMAVSSENSDTGADLRPMVETNGLWGMAAL